MTTPDDTNEARGASSGTTRTPPPRTRRGSTSTRGAASFEELDGLDAFLPADQPAEVVDPVPPLQTKRGRSASPSTAYSWETPEGTAVREATQARATTTNRDATLAASAAAAEVYGDPVEPEIAFEPASPRPTKAKAARRPERRFRQTIQKVDLWSVTKMALCFYVSAMGVVVVSLVALWVVADSAGIIDNVENFIGDLFSSDDFQFVSGQVLRGAVLIGVVLVALLVAFTIIAASFYNIFAELFGGVEIVIREEEQPPKR